MRLERPAKKPPQDPTIALINIVFLMLIFFLLAGTLAPGTDRDIDLIRTSDAEREKPPVEPISVTADGEIRYGGKPVSRDGLVERLRQARPATGNADADGIEVLADRSLSARDLIDLIRMLQAQGYSARIVTRMAGAS
ncbi:ExbD/TolR family protein [Consotaella aegiceratis]|uniref:ExbD/TolR family protein n=1 Tax=Consotaella aegiceratis TaxID=3097961 RepID=UPI002F41F3B5